MSRSTFSCKRQEEGLHGFRGLPSKKWQNIDGIRKKCDLAITRHEYLGQQWPLVKEWPMTIDICVRDRQQAS
jgi:hypothetical protein